MADAILSFVSEHPDPYSTYFAGEKLEQEISSVLIAYRLTLAGAPRVESTPLHRDDSMETYSVHVRAGDGEITLSIDDWGVRRSDHSCADGSGGVSTSRGRG